MALSYKLIIRSACSDSLRGISIFMFPSCVPESSHLMSIVCVACRYQCAGGDATLVKTGDVRVHTLQFKGHTCDNLFLWGNRIGGGDNKKNDELQEMLEYKE